mgnify:CR=1 FL=1
MPGTEAEKLTLQQTLNFKYMGKNNLKNKQQCVIHDVIYSHYLERVERERREKQVMLDLWYMATNGKQVILCVGNDCI